MVVAVAGAAAAIYGLAHAGVEIRRRLTIRARVSRRLQWKHGPKIAHFYFQSAALMPHDADPA
jgi:hypothetical protein